MNRYLCFILLVISQYKLGAQGNIRDSSLFITSVRISYAAQLPGGSMVNRFGWNSNLGFHVDVKNRHSVLFGIEGNFLFGNKVKEDVLSLLRNEDSAIIDQSGNYAKVLTYERGFIINGYAGYLFNSLGPNPNSGILVKIGVGFMQHKIRIEHNKNAVPALNGDYIKGYDRLTNGINFTEFVGYQLLSNSRLLNFFAGFEFSQAFTQSRRDWDTDLFKANEEKRIDVLSGFRVGWILPLYKRAPKEFYY